MHDTTRISSSTLELTLTPPDKEEKDYGVIKLLDSLAINWNSKNQKV